MFEIWAQTDKGRIRKQNQDTFRYEIFNDSVCFAAVCDGMGGEAGGDIAASLCADTILSVMRKLKNTRNIDERAVSGQMFCAVLAANSVVYEKSCKTPNLGKMGTTVSMAVACKNTIYTCNVGDSRVYLIKDSHVRQLTHDHSIVQIMVDNGEISLKDAAFHPKKNYITRAVGVMPSVDADFEEHEICGNYELLICSDGLSNYCSDEDIAEIMNDVRKIKSVTPFIEYALSKGGHDNITAVVVSVTADKGSEVING